jgi:hypothetical protein
MSLPTMEQHLPALYAFAHQLARDFTAGRWHSAAEITEAIKLFYTPTLMAEIERVVPGWGKMASYADGQTLYHVTTVLTTLFTLDEYKRLRTDQRVILQWMVLFHDVAKEAKRGTHDLVHGFRSAAIAGRALAQIGFPATLWYNALIETWFALTDTATTAHEKYHLIQDNRKLPTILMGIDQLYGVYAPAGMIIRGVLFHVSIATDPDYPTAAPLSDQEADQFISRALFPLLRLLMLADVESWFLFDPAGRSLQRQYVVGAFERIGTRFGVR